MTDQIQQAERLLAEWSEASGRQMLTVSERVDLLQLINAAFDTAAPAVGAPVASGVLPLPAPAFELTWRDGAYRVSAPGLSAAKCYIADQMHEYAARCMLHAIPAPPAASLREQEDAARYRWLRSTTNTFTNDAGERIDVKLHPEQWDAMIDAQRLGREKEHTPIGPGCGSLD